MTKRCNEVPDCADGSDEFFCELIGFHGKSYRKLIAPKENNGRRTKIEVKGTGEACERGALNFNFRRASDSVEFTLECKSHGGEFVSRFVFA